MTSHDIWMEILKYAKWAPSPHNTQLWKVKIKDDQMEVFYDEARLLPVENESNSFMICAMGVFIEAISIASAPMGYTILPEYRDQKEKKETKHLNYFCTLRLQKSESNESLGRELLLERKTSRLPYKSMEVPVSILEQLKEEALRFGHIFSFSNNKEMVEKVLILNKNTLFYDMEDTATRNEVDNWIRYSSSEARKRADGLWTRCLRMPGIFTHLFFRVRWLFNLGFVKKFIGSFYLKTTKGTKTIAWLSGPMNNQTEWVNSGRMLLRLWLMLAKEKIYMHPFGSIITNPKSHIQILPILNIKEESNQTLWLIMRLGYSDEPPRSYRLNTSQLIIT